jgi:hypothetical protein
MGSFTSHLLIESLGLDWMEIGSDELLDYNKSPMFLLVGEEHYNRCEVSCSIRAVDYFSWHFDRLWLLFFQLPFSFMLDYCPFLVNTMVYHV